MTDTYKIAIVGSGPSGLSAAARAAQLGIPHLLIEAAPHLANTIHRYQKRKLVMAEPRQLPLRSALSFAAGAREAILDTWQQEADKLQVNCRFGAAVTQISGQRGAFHLTLASGEQVVAEHVVLAIGLQGNIRKLEVTGNDLPWVQYQLDDPEEYDAETIVVVGAGDAGIENALALAKQNRVILINREAEFNFCKQANLDLLMTEVNAGRMEMRVSASVAQVEACHDGHFNMVLHLQTPQGGQQIKCHRIIARLGAVAPRALIESFGITFPNAQPTALPQLNERYESNVPGLYVVGALAGYPLIKQAINQGYEVVEYILGHAVERADEALLREKFVGLSEIASADEAIELIRTTQPLFSGLTPLQLRELLMESAVHAPAKGDVVFYRNDYSDSFYSVLRGEVTVHAADKSGKDHVVQMQAGDFFGEIGLLNGRRRSATVVAGEHCVLLETPRRAMLKLLNAAQSVKRKLDEISLKRVVQVCLDSSVPKDDLEQLVKTAQVKHFAVGDALFHQGDLADGLYMIRKGSVTVSRVVGGKEIILAYVAAGHYVGEMALLSDEPRSATVRAAAPTEVILLEAQRLNELLQSNPTLKRKVYGQYLARTRTDEELTEQDEGSDLVKFLMAQGVGEATDVLLIDYSRCIRCDNCERACAEVHEGSSRLSRQAGPTYGQIHVPTSCRHCEHPHCMKDCPPDAIHRAVNGEVYISDSCIGCGNCQRNCPYGVIQMEAAREHAGSSLWRILSGGGGTHDRSAATQEGESQKPKKAVKCDMCKDLLTGPACVQMCPTGAAIRVNPERFLSLTK